MASPYDILFEPVKIGPVTAPNRFYQVPHCTGMGYTHPRTLAAMRATKAEGGWGVVCTEYCSMHPTSDDTPFPHQTLWDDDDIRNVSRMTEAVHEHGSLAGVELWHGGARASNLHSRVVGLGAQSMPVTMDPIQTRAMDGDDIREFRRWHRDAVKRAKQAEFDIVYVYACHGYLLSQFLSRAYNTRSDEYGGSLENRTRLVRELLEETRQEAGDRMAVAIRFAVNGLGEAHMSTHEARDVVEMLGGLPDLWDVTVGDYDHEMGSSRFVQEGSLEEHVSWVREVTGKPVVSVGRFTSPDTMVRQVKQGVLDLVGAARPSIADPFLPNKVREGRLEDIRECIGCNICYSGASRAVPIRCTQNPAMGEEWRRGWHPEHIPADISSRSNNEQGVLIIGAGPAGLEAGHILAKRGFDVTIADAAKEAGGRVTRESRLPGLSEWARVRDYRMGQIGDRANVQLYLGSHMSVEDVIEFDADHVIVATGARWRRNGVGRTHPIPLPDIMCDRLLTPDDIMDGTPPESGSVTVFDDEHYYMGAVVADKLAQSGCAVTYVTTEGVPGAWSANTSEQTLVHQRLLSLGVSITGYHSLVSFDGKIAEIECVFSGERRPIESEWVVSVTSRDPQDDLFLTLKSANHGKSVARIGDCDAPGIIAMAVYAGHEIGRSLGAPHTEVGRDRALL